MITNDGGPMFPHDGQSNYTGGMSLRDWFAGMALQGIRANPSIEMNPKDIAELCYRQAASMLAARERKE